MSHVNPLHYVVRRSAPVYAVFRWIRDSTQRRAWRRHGQPVPPPGVVKREIISACSRRHHAQVLVETGTFLGDTLWAVRDRFETIHSIELDPELHAFARRRLQKFPHIHLHCGDSGDVLRSLLPTLSKPCVFWLDGHYSGGGTARGAEHTPIRRELGLILSHAVSGYVLLIDDARCFCGADGYPTLDELRAIIVASNPNLQMAIADDIVRVEPNVDTP